MLLKAGNPTALHFWSLCGHRQGQNSSQQDAASSRVLGGTVLCALAQRSLRSAGGLTGRCLGEQAGGLSSAVISKRRTESILN